MARGAGYYHVRWDELEDYPGEKTKIYSGPLACANFAFIISRQDPGAVGVHHSHDVAEEVYVLLRGEGVVRVGDETVALGVHDALRVEPGVEHSTINPGSEEAWWLVIGAPADEFIAWDPVAYGPPAG